MEMVSWGMEIHSPVSYLWSSDWLLAMNKTGSWTMEENKIFEKALAIHDKETPDRWQKIVEMIPGKSMDEVKRHYRDLEEDVSHIEAGLIPIPGYNSSPFTLECVSSRGFDGTKQTYGVGGKRSGARPSDHERKKGVPWTEEEHRLFLMGLKKYGKGDWRNISRNFVISRTPTQVASHAQKYFIRLSSGGKDKRRSSIHDITTVNLPDNRPPSPSQSSAPTTTPSSTVKTETAEHFSGALNTNQCKEAAAFFNSMASQTNSNLFAHHPYGSNPYGVKYEPQTLHQDYLHESVVGQQNIFHRLQSAQCHPRG